jgi:hypothetical protein
VVEKVVGRGSFENCREEILKKDSGALANFMLFECVRAIDRFSNLLNKIKLLISVR